MSTQDFNIICRGKFRSDDHAAAFEFHQTITLVTAKAPGVTLIVSGYEPTSGSGYWEIGSNSNNDVSSYHGQLAADAKSRGVDITLWDCRPT